DLHFAARLVDRHDQAGGGLRSLAHRHRRLLGRGRDLAGLAEHAARRLARLGRLVANLAAAARGVIDDSEDFLVELVAERAAPGALAVRAQALEMIAVNVDLEQRGARRDAGE